VPDPQGSRQLIQECLFARTELCLLRLTEQYLPRAEPQEVQSDNAQNFDPAWLPDGTGLVFASGSNEEFGLWRTSTSSGSRPQKLPFTANNATEPALSLRGNRLAYTEYRFDTNIWSMDLIGPNRRPGAPVPIISSTRPDWEPTCSPDGKRIAFVSSRSGPPELWACDRDGSNPVQLTSLGVEASARHSIERRNGRPMARTLRSTSGERGREKTGFV
jgi:Tol biopolymer transport system component